MAALRTLSVKLIVNESGAETIEYAMVIGLIVVGVIAVALLVGTKVLGRWTTIKNSGV